ncbi:ABC transporter permease subunit [Myceligenerans salitolerans]|uniref:ABC transporter permease subunit n=1 Tax=Myceligenerans salitolerans TaxID=1230528 RepID=A0ABS3IDR5_9MICO|nr:ABC transporter permease subunit [Myceligenerans salitolerans]MBO0611187.1 ABC transporter permease subunit [Myceligenerans salitolerans]
MSTTTLDAPEARTPSSTVPVKKVTFGRLLHSEWIKLWSLRSTWWTLGSTVVILVGFGFMMAIIAQLFTDQMSDMSAEEQAATGGEQLFTAPIVITGGYEFAALVVAVLGSMLITGEYSTGMIRSTFTAAPHRLGAYFAKATVLAGVTAVLIAVSLALAWLVTYPILDSNGITVDWGDSDQVRQLYGTVLYTVLVALFALGVGTLIRHTAGAIFTVVAIFLVIPIVFGIATFAASQVSWVLDVNKFLPSIAGSAITPAAAQTPEVLDPWVGAGVLAAYTAAVLIAGAISLKTRDA